MQSCHESISSSILMYLTFRGATCHVSTVAAGQCRRTLQAAAGHYTVMLLWRLVTVIDVLRHSCGQVDWRLTEQNYTYSKIPTILLEIVSCGGLRRPAVIGRTDSYLCFTNINVLWHLILSFWSYWFLLLYVAGYFYAVSSVIMIVWISMYCMNCAFIISGDDINLLDCIL